MSKQPKLIEKKKYQTNAEDFIPYACHYDKETIITKNGELLQVIKVTGFNYETIGEDSGKMLSLREYIREAVSESVLTNDIALWFTTIRRKMNIAPDGEFKTEFSKDLNDAWIEKNGWDNQFVTELYISILIEGEKLSIGSPRLFFESLNIPRNIKKRRNVLESQHQRLSEISGNILSRLQKFGARKLSVYKEEGIYYSEMAEFISKILNLRQQRIKFVPFELSDILPINKTMFQYNSLEVQTETGKRHLGAIMTIKQYHEIPAKYIDEILQLPVQFIITETFDFIHEDEVRDSFEPQKKIFEMSGDEYTYKASGLWQILQADTEKQTDYGEHQITITVLEDTVKELNKSITVISKSLRNLGILVVREDLFMEECYWSQLPGNFDFIKRKSYIPTVWAGGYASLYNFPVGKIENNQWGPAVTVFYTDNYTPYYFNFHLDKTGHTSIIGPRGAGKTVLLNFLLAQADKFEPKIYYFDYARHSEIFIRASGGKYNKITNNPQMQAVSLNPLNLADNIENRNFLKQWFAQVIAFADKDNMQEQISDDDRAKILRAVEQIFSQPVEMRDLAATVRDIWGYEEHGTSARLSGWLNNGFAAYFSRSIENQLEFSQGNIFGFDMTEVSQNPATAIPVIQFILHKIEMQLDKKVPSIIVLDEAWKYIDNQAFAAELDNWLYRFGEKNAIVIFASESIEEIANSKITRPLMNKLATQIYLPNQNAPEEYKTVFGLNDQEYEAIRSIQKTKRKFLLKQDGVSVVALLELKEFGDYLHILSSTEKELQIFDELYGQSDNWLANYKQKWANEDTK